MGQCKRWSAWFSTILLLFENNRGTKAYMSSSCWDGTSAVDYIGTVAITSTGRTCQQWSEDAPQSHNYHGTDYFPYDGDDVAASNYCRDPDGESGSSGMWCYTMDPTERYEYCNIPLCYNLPCAEDAINGQSDPSTVTDVIGARKGTTFLQKSSTPHGFSCCGTIKQWRVYIKNTGSIRLQVWRHDSSSGNYTLKGENVYSYASNGEVDMQHDETVPQSDRISVQEGDVMGWYSDMIPYSSTVVTNPMAMLSSSVTAIGGSLDFSDAKVKAGREYAIGAQLAASLAPYFVTTNASITVSPMEIVGNTVYTVTILDDDVDDVSLLTVSLDPNTYFDVNGTDIIVKSSLDVGTETLYLTVTDQCSQTGLFTLTVTISGVAITSLPVTTNVSEWLTAETLVHTLVLDPTGTYTCTLDSYTPTRTEGNPFIVKNTPSSDMAIYLKAAATIRYNVATSYNVTITCTNTDPESGTNYIIIDVNPSTQPAFSNFQSSLTIDADTATINEVVYTATVTDADGYDPITMSLICDPSSCPFTITNDCEISITADPMNITQSTYTLIVVADDGFTSVTSSNISVTITNINVKSVITNLPTSTQTVLENEVAGTVVYQVLQSDADGDTPTFHVTFSSTTCVGMYTIGSTDGNVETLTPLDYESGVSCELTITVFDGRATSDPETLTIDIGDVDEPPVMSNTAYVISTEEVVDDTTLPDAGINATDPEGTAVSFSISCQYLTIDSTSGIVTMTTSYDIETSATNPYTIPCVVMATDATSQTSTATLDVIVSDGNDNAPVFTQITYTFYIYEGHTGYSIIDSVTATDSDVTSPNNAVTYSITPTTSFSIGGLGNIQNTVDLSSAADGTTYTLTATATDGGTPPLSDTSTVVISILSTTTTTTAAGAAVGSNSGATSTDVGFFSDAGNVAFLITVLLTAALVCALVGIQAWIYFFKPRLTSNNMQPSKMSSNENNHIALAVHNTPGSRSILSATTSGKSNQSTTLEMKSPIGQSNGQNTTDFQQGKSNQSTTLEMKSPVGQSNGHNTTDFQQEHPQKTASSTNTNRQNGRLVSGENGHRISSVKLVKRTIRQAPRKRERTFDGIFF